MKVYIKRSEKKSKDAMATLTTAISLDAVKPYSISEDEWDIIRPLVKEINSGKANSHKNIPITEGWDDLHAIVNEKEWGILAESEHYYIRREYEDAVLYSKPDSKHIACVGRLYGEPHDAYIDPRERFCITTGCGIIKYMFSEPFESYMCDRDTSQWIEVGREGDIEWYDHIDKVTDSYVEVSLEGEERCRFNLDNLKKEK